MNHAVGATVVTVVILATSLLGGPHSKTDFSGTWEMDMTRSESPYYDESKKPVTVVINKRSMSLVWRRAETDLTKLSFTKWTVRRPRSRRRQWSIQMARPMGRAEANNRSAPEHQSCDSHNLRTPEPD